jgi:hypothetical protein
MPAVGGVSTTPAGAITQVYTTVEARLTQGPTQTLLASLSPRASGDPSTAATVPAVPVVSETRRTTPEPTLVCDRAVAGNPIDLSIPDDTPMQPGQVFTKRWALRNAGSCTWTADYAVKFLYGERMGAPDTAQLSRIVLPGQTVEIAIDMVAPIAPGAYRGNWKLRNARDTLFGIGPNGSSPFWVQIEVLEPATETPGPPTFTPAPTPTITPTPATYAGGSVTLTPGSRLDLDAARLNPESGEDLIFENQPDGTHALVPLGSTRIGLFGTNPPTLADCQVAALSPAPLVVENLGSTYLCYQTSQGLPGRALLKGLKIDDFSLSLDLLTWMSP